MSNKDQNEQKVMMRTDRTPGEVIIARRKSLCWSQEELSWRTGLSRVQIGKIERDIAKPTYETIKVLEDALEIPLLDLFMKNSKRKIVAKRRIKGQESSLKNFMDRVRKITLSEEKMELLLDKTILELEQAEAERCDEERESGHRITDVNSDTSEKQRKNS